MNLPPYSIFPSVTDEKVLLRQITPADMPYIVEISFYDAVQAATVSEASEMQDKIDRDYLEENSIHWGITDKLSGNIVGTCGYYRGLRKGEGELGCVLLPQYRNQGYMAAAMVLAIQFGRHNIGLSRIWAGTNRDNAAAVRLIEKLGFIKVADKEDGEVEYELRHQAR